MNALCELIKITVIGGVMILVREMKNGKGLF